ncbi:MAG: class I SAM-dependent methyltransferase [Acidobacteria bacterium]|nr:class I SAM-dependent methyltransferase [Acidobacteriota bacterium]
MDTAERVPSFFDPKEFEDWKRVRGWKTGEIAEAFYRHVRNLNVAGAVVEIGSYAGKSTICIARAVKDRHKGQQKMAAIDKSFQQDFIPNLRRFGVAAFVNPINAMTTQAAETWNEPIAFLYYDGFTDRQALTDFIVWDHWIAVGGTVALDNTAGFWVGPGLAVQAAIGSGAYRCVEDVCGVTFLRKKRPIENIGEHPRGEGTLRAHLDYVGAWTGAFTLDLERPRPVYNHRQPVSHRVRRSLIKGWRKGWRLLRRSPPARATPALSEASQILSRLERQVAPDSTAAPSIAYLKACLALRQGRLSDAIPILIRLSDLPLDSAFMNYRLGVRETALLRLGQAYDLQGDRTKAQRTYRELLQMAETMEIAGAAKRWLDEPFKRAEPAEGKLLREYVANDPLGRYRSSFFPAQ